MEILVLRVAAEDLVAVEESLVDLVVGVDPVDREGLVVGVDRVDLAAVVALDDLVAMVVEVYPVVVVGLEDLEGNFHLAVALQLDLLVGK